MSWYSNLIAIGRDRLSLKTESFSSVMRGDFHDGVTLREKRLAQVTFPRTVYRTPARITRTLQAKNILMNVPVLREAVEGDIEARQLYENRRLLYLHACPEWVKEKITSDIEQGYIDSFVRGVHRKVKKAFVSRVKISPLKSKFLVSGFNLDGFLTYSAAKGFLEHLSRIDFKESNSEKKGLNAQESFTPASAGKQGDIARHLLKNLIEFMFKATVLEDILTYWQIDLSYETKMNIIQSAKSAWDIADGKKMRNVFLLDEAFCNEFYFFDSEERMYLFHKYLNAKDPVAKLSADYSQETQPSPEEKEEKQTDESLEVDAEADFRASFVQGLYTALKVNQPHVKGKMAISKRFYRLHVKGACSYTEVFKSIVSREDPYEAMEAFYLHRLRRETEQLDTESSAEAQSKTTIAQDPEETLSPIFLYQNDTSVPFQAWLDGLERSNQERIKAVLFRLESGNAGVSKMITRRKGRIYELKLQFGGGFRIYYRKLRNNELLILNAEQRTPKIAIWIKLSIISMNTTRTQALPKTTTPITTVSGL